MCSGDGVENSHIWTDRIVPDSHMRRMIELSCALRNMWHSGGRVDGRARDFTNEPDVAVVDDFETTTQDVEGQDGM